MPVAWVPYDGWSPAAGYFGEGWASARNLWSPYGEARPWRRFVTAGTDTLDGPMVGQHVHKWASGFTGGAYRPDEQTVFVGSNGGRLYTVDTSTGAMTDVSRVGAYTGDSAGWRGVSIGNDIWMTNWIDQWQRRTNNAGLFANGIVSTYRPRPRFCAAIREFMVGWNISNDRQDKLVWSDADDATNFDPATGTSTSLASSKVLPEIPGQGTGLVGGLYGLAFKREGIYYLEYAGLPAVFRPDVLSPRIGTAYPSSIVPSEHGVFFLGPDGFYQIQGIAPPVKISTPGIDQFLLDSNFSVNALGTYYPWIEDIQMVGFDCSPWPLVGWIFRRNLGEHGNDLALLYNPITRQWEEEDIADPNEGETLAHRPTAIVTRPYADDQYQTLAAFTWDGMVSRYAPLSNSSANVFAPSIQLRYRPSGVAELPHNKQSLLEWVLPMFSKAPISGAALTETVTANALLDPHNSVWKTETSLAANRDATSGVYPFQIAGRFFQILIPCAAEDFASFQGAWISTRPLP